MVKTRKGRVYKTLNSDADKNSLEIANATFQKSVDLVLSQSGGNNKKYFKEYYNYMVAKGLKIRSIEANLKALRYFNDFLSKTEREAPILARYKTKNVQVIAGKDMKKVTRRDIESFIASKKYLSQSTIEHYKIFLKVFFQWLYNCNITKKEYPEVVDWIRTTTVKKNHEDYELIEKDTIKKLCDNCLYLRDKAMIMVLYDAGLRISELANLKFKDVKLDEYGIRIIVRGGKNGGKSKEDREIRLTDSVPVLKQLINTHPFKEDKEKNLFICLGSYYGKPVTSQGAYKIIEKTRIRAGIDKKIHPHAFRHTRLTELAKGGFREMELRLFAGWSKSSTMPEVYLHFNKEDLDNKILMKNKMKSDKQIQAELKRQEEERKKLQPLNCPQCGEKNDANNKFCLKCGLILDLKEAGRILDKKEQHQKELMQLGATLKELSSSEDFMNVFNNAVQIFKETGGRSKKELEQMEQEAQESEEYMRFEKQFKHLTPVKRERAIKFLEKDIK
jgi:integrase/recombinase XerD